MTNAAIPLNRFTWESAMSQIAAPDEVKQILDSIGFQDISITPKLQSDVIIQSWNILKAKPP